MSNGVNDGARRAGAVRRVAAGYDLIAEQYVADRSMALPPMLAPFAATLPDGAPVLDLGCGAGVPIGAWLARRFAVTGVDVSARQLALARRHVPGATLLRADLASVRFPVASFALIVAAHSIIHVPREEHGALVARIAGWLRPGGAFLASWATEAWEGEEANWEGWGAAMWWSHFGAATNRALLGDAGFDIGAHDVVTTSSGGETWMWVLARKPGDGG